MANKKLFYSGLALIGILLMSIAGYSYGNALVEESAMVMVSHSEYWTGETGQIIGKLYNYRGQPILADCNVTIYNPDKTTFLAQTPTTDTLEATDGTHYLDFATPTLEGVYEYMLKCDYTLNNKPFSRTISNSFHLSPALNTIKNINSSISGIGNIYPTLVEVNNTVNNIYADLFSDIDAYNNFTAIDTNFGVVNTKLDNVNQSLETLKQYCSNAETNSSDLCQMVWSIDLKTTSIDNTLTNVVVAQLNVINATTDATYNYLIGTVTTNLNNILIDVGIIKDTTNQINATVNRIETNVTTIITNQEEMVYIDVMS